jgi:thiamine biosynthesis lipoprotein
LTSLAAALLLVSAVGSVRRADAATARGGNVVMGTVLQVTVVADSQELAKSLVDRSFEIARRWDDVLTTWRPEGELARLNVSAGAEITVSSELAWALRAMLDHSRETNGAFDPGVGAVVRRLREGTPNAVVPTDPTTSHIGHALKLDGDKARLLAGAELDAGGIGKGIALDAIAGYLQTRASAYYLDFGGSSQLAAGKREDGAAWNVVIAGNAKDSILGMVSLDGNALSTSRTLDADDAGGTIVDPATLLAVTPPRLATALAETATAAEAWSTALIVLGPAGLELAQTSGVGALLEIDGSVSTTRDFPMRSLGSRPSSR